MTISVFHNFISLFSVRAYDVTCPEKGVVFRIPITVVKPSTVPTELPPDLSFKNVTFKPNTIKRHFILVPDKASWAGRSIEIIFDSRFLFVPIFFFFFSVMRLKCTEKDKSGKFAIHCVQLRPHLVCKALEFHKLVNIVPRSDNVQGFPVRVSLFSYCF